MTVKAYLKTNRLLLFAGILTLMAGLWLNLMSFRRFPNMTFGGYIIYLLPGLLLLLSWFLASTFLRLRWLFIGLGIVITLLASGFALLMHSMGEYLAGATAEIQDAARYEEILASYPESWVAHFPSSVPAEATQVTFYYLPAFLQGGSYLQLRCTLPPSVLDDVLGRYRPIAKQVENGAGEIIEDVDIQGDLPTPLFRNGENTGFDSLPQHFLILILDGEPYKPEDWNHGYTYGVAVSTQGREAIFWVEYW